MKGKPLVSVIVPVYNAGGYLEECLDSIASQSYDNLDIILVDDGSTDGSAGRCDAFAKRDSRVKVLHQKNMGAVSARKNGVGSASGEYLCFMDADDRADPGMAAFFVENIGQCDLLTSGCKCEICPDDYEIWTDALREGIYDTKKEKKYFLENMISYENRFRAGVQPYLWGKLYRTELLRDVIEETDPSIVYSEDRDLLFRYILKAGGIRITHKSYYFYRYNPDSIMRTVNRNFMSDLNKLYLSLSKAFAGHPQEESLRHQLELFLVSRIYLIPSFMGFSADAQIVGYVFPFSELEQGSRIVLYGAGTIGMRYYRQIYRQNLLQIVAWVDKNWKQYADCDLPVSALEKLAEYNYDYIVIAVKKKEMAEEIKKELTRQGIAEECILWREPAVV